MEAPKYELAYLDDGQIAHIRECMRILDSCTQVENAWAPMLQREGDQSLMSAFLAIEGKGVTKRTLKMANDVRLWLRVVTVTELVDNNGNGNGR